MLTTDWPVSHAVGGVDLQYSLILSHAGAQKHFVAAQRDRLSVHMSSFAIDLNIVKWSILTRRKESWIDIPVADWLKYKKTTYFGYTARCPHYASLVLLITIHHWFPLLLTPLQWSLTAWVTQRAFPTLQVWRRAVPANRKPDREETACLPHTGRGSDDAGGASEWGAALC